jgi:hypothetical protein
MIKMQFRWKKQSARYHGQIEVLRYYFQIFFLSAGMILAAVSPVRSYTFDARGLVAAWGAFSRSGITQAQLGVRFLPELTLAISLRDRNFSLASRFSVNNLINRNTEKATYRNSSSVEGHPDAPQLTAEFSLNMWGSATFRSSEENSFRSKIKPYRLSLKYTTRRFEARLGLQKISFGSATLLRPLMWFDRLDPRDPIQLSDGVYSLLLRTFLSEKTNLWCWALYGNKDTKGWELIPSKKTSPEFGARAQIPLGKGELALTFHHRRALFDSASPSGSFIPVRPESPPSFSFPENRIAADGKWDIGAGFWFEAVLTRQRSSFFIYPWQRALTAGLDYTFGLGNGLHVLGEYYQSDSARGAFSSTTAELFSIRFLAASASYPVNFLDHLSAIVFYDTRSRDLYSFVRWQRTYDRWSLNIMAFWNPEEFRIYASSGETNLLAGKGLQIMVIYNY